MTRSDKDRPSESDSAPATPIDWAVEDATLHDYVDASLTRLKKARSDTPGVVSYGASNYPHDPDFWAADWRDVLPPDDPRRKTGPPIIKDGTVAAYRSMQEAHRAARKAFGLPPENDDHR